MKYVKRGREKHPKKVQEHPLALCLPKNPAVFSFWKKLPDFWCTLLMVSACAFADRNPEVYGQKETSGIELWYDRQIKYKKEMKYL